MSYCSVAESTCPHCKKVFKPNRPEQLYCSGSCAAKAQWQRPEVRQKMFAARPDQFPIQRKQFHCQCILCGKKFVVHRKQDRRIRCADCKVVRLRGIMKVRYANCPRCGKLLVVGPKNRTFCSRSCAVKARWENPTFRASMVSKAGKAPGQRRRASQWMKELNQRPEMIAQRERYYAKLRGKTFVGKRGGNGTYTPQQVKLREALGWPEDRMEHTIRSPLPNWRNMFVDLANPALKIAIEIDGGSHHTAKQKNRDRIKTRTLESMGWRVLRFWNSQIDSNLESVVEAISEAELAALSQSSNQTSDMSLFTT